MLIQTLFCFMLLCYSFFGQNLLLKAVPSGWVIKIADFGLSNTHEVSNVVLVQMFFIYFMFSVVHLSKIKIELISFFSHRHRLFIS